MAAEADDLRYSYAEDLGDTQEVDALADTATSLDEKLTPGRYVLRIIDFGGATDVWVRFGGQDAAAAEPAMRFRAHTEPWALNLPLLTFIARPGRDEMSFFAVGAQATVQLTKVSRGRA